MASAIPLTWFITAGPTQGQRRVTQAAEELFSRNGGGGGLTSVHVAELDLVGHVVVAVGGRVYGRVCELAVGARIAEGRQEAELRAEGDRVEVRTDNLRNTQPSASTAPAQGRNRVAVRQSMTHWPSATQKLLGRQFRLGLGRRGGGGAARGGKRLPLASSCARGTGHLGPAGPQ